MTYKRITEAERSSLYRWRKEGRGVREISRRLGRAASRITRELARNLGRRGYRVKQAQRQAQARAQRPGSRRFTMAGRQEAEARLKAGWTPEMIGARARLEGQPWVGKETIYKHVYADAKAGGTLWERLPRARRQRRRRCPRQAGRGRGRIPNQRMTDTRPAEVAMRADDRALGRRPDQRRERDRQSGHAGGTPHAVFVIGHTVSKAAEEGTRSICAMFNSTSAKGIDGRPGAAAQCGSRCNQQPTNVQPRTGRPRAAF